jgi:hypothetical protein
MNANIIKWECNCLASTVHIESVSSVWHVSIFDTNLRGYIQLFNFIKLLPVLKYYIMHGFKLRHMQLQLWLHIKDFARSPQRNASHIDSIFPRFFFRNIKVRSITTTMTTILNYGAVFIKLWIIYLKDTLRIRNQGIMLQKVMHKIFEGHSWEPNKKSN